MFAQKICKKKIEKFKNVWKIKKGAAKKAIFNSFF